MRAAVDARLLLVVGCGRVDFAHPALVDSAPPTDAPAGIAVPIVNPGCEDGTTNWSGFGGTLVVSSTAHSRIVLREWQAGVDVGNTAGAPVVLSETTWQHVTVMRTVTAVMDDSLDIFIPQDPVLSSCFLVDDVALWRLP